MKLYKNKFIKRKGRKAVESNSVTNVVINKVNSNSCNRKNSANKIFCENKSNKLLFILTRTYFIGTILNFRVDITGKIMLSCFGKKRALKKIKSQVSIIC